jgi:hypothetical protein
VEKEEKVSRRRPWNRKLSVGFKQSYDRETDSLITPFPSSYLSYFSCLAYSAMKIEIGISRTLVPIYQTT